MFYTFNQNNSGGVFDRDVHVDQFVVIEGDSIEEITERAQEWGIYFDGCNKGFDCECCGDRWSTPWSDAELDEVPSTYGQPITKIKDKQTKSTNVVIHYAKGKVKYGINPNSLFKN